MEPGDIDGGTPPPAITSKDSQLARPGPVPLHNDSWDADSGWLHSVAAVGESEGYQGRRRTKGTGAASRWWIGGAAALIASTATVALIMAPSSGPGDSNAASPGADSATAQVSSSTEVGELPVGGGSAPVGEPTAPAGGQGSFAVTIEAESGSPIVILSGSAVVESDARASGGQIVTKLGNHDEAAGPGSVQIGGISLPSTGNYRISIHYVNRDDTSQSSAIVTVTGAEPTTVNFTGNKKCCGVRTIEMTLGAGPHVLTIANATGPAPSIDKIIVSRV